MPFIALTILGLEMALAGGVWILAALGVSPGMTLKIYGLVAVLSLLLPRGKPAGLRIGDLMGSVRVATVRYSGKC